MKKYTTLIASYCLSNNASINIYAANEEMVKWSLNDGRINTSPVRWDKEEPYFKAYGREIKLDQCERV